MLFRSQSASVELSRDEMIKLLGDKVLRQLERRGPEPEFYLRLRHLRVRIWWFRKLKEYIYEIEGSIPDLAEVSDYASGKIASPEIYEELRALGYFETNVA